MSKVEVTWIENMEFVAFILLLFGLVAIWIEFYVPGGVMAIVGGLFVVVSFLTFFGTSSSQVMDVLYFIFCIVSIGVVIKLAIWRIKKSSESNTFYLEKDQEGYTAPSIYQDLIGKKGIALTDLRPAGFVVIEGNKYPAVCKGPYLDKGVEVIVLLQEVGHLVVKPAK
jgi:membrane-bound ClpP family serine protease